MPEYQKTESERPSGQFLCPDCRARNERTKTYLQPNCTQYGKDVSNEIGPDRHCQYICTSCQCEPVSIVRRLIASAQSGERDLQSIKDYKIEKQLGKGGMGAVYLDRHVRTGQQVALKVMLPQVAADDRSRKLFLREIKNSSALDHPHIVKVFDYGHSQGTFFYA